MAHGQDGVQLQGTSQVFTMSLTAEHCQQREYPTTASLAGLSVQCTATSTFATPQCVHKTIPQLVKNLVRVIGWGAFFFSCCLELLDGKDSELHSCTSVSVWIYLSLSVSGINHSVFTFLFPTFYINIFRFFCFFFLNFNFSILLYNGQNTAIQISPSQGTVRIQRLRHIQGSTEWTGNSYEYTFKLLKYLL